MTCPGDCGCGLSDALVRNVLDDSLFNRFVYVTPFTGCHVS